MEKLEAYEELDISWVVDDFGVKVSIVLGNASIVIEHDHDDSDVVPWLIGALPQIMSQVADAMEAQEAQEGK